MLSRPGILEKLIHFSQLIALYTLWFQILKHPEGVRVDIFLVIFTNIMFSYYGLGRKWGLFYSILSILPIVIHLNNGGFTHQPAITSNSFSFITSIIFYFLIVIVSHHFYHTALYETIDEKTELNKQLEKSARAKSDFLLTMSHELRTPLNIVMGITDVLLQDKPRKEQKENLDILKFSSESLLILINDILDFNRFESKKVELEYIPFNIANLLQDIHSGFRIKAAEKGLVCNLVIDPAIAKQNVIGDPTRFIQIVFNLVGNAIKFTQEGQVDIGASVVSKDKDLIRILFSVSDTGIGISADQQKIIFDPFRQASTNITREFGGTGLGLAIVKHLLNLHHSAIQLESRENEGTRFSFEITFPTSPLNTDTINAFGSTMKKVDLAHLRVLLAEDNPMNVTLMKKIFLTWNNTITVAEDGKEVIDKLAKNSFDVILMDINMPRMNGYETTTRIRQLEDKVKSTIHIIALTAWVASDVTRRIREVGMDDYLIKPFKPNELQYKLSKLMAEKQ
ncbi:response regulator [Larkinella sp. C7]|uniref:response regulator n=1 Tax=Larkinella sp. C7 TaxID=2576607 RepID=UPI0014864600|nr:response regulator [Larkinella sp. C7]